MFWGGFFWGTTFGEPTRPLKKKKNDPIFFKKKQVRQTACYLSLGLALWPWSSQTAGQSGSPQPASQCRQHGRPDASRVGGSGAGRAARAGGGSQAARASRGGSERSQARTTIFQSIFC